MPPDMLEKLSIASFAFLVLTLGFIGFEWKSGAFQTHESRVYSVDAGDYNLLATANEDEILLWNGRYCIGRLSGHTGTIKSISFSRDGKHIASGAIDKSVRIWSVAEGKEVMKLTGHSEGVNEVRFGLSDQYLISSGYDQKVKIWDWRNTVLLKSLDARRTEISINDSEILAYAALNCTVTLLDLKSLLPVDSLPGICGAPAFIPGGDFIAVKSDSGRFDFINLEKGAQPTGLRTHGDNFGPSAISPDGRVLAVGVAGGKIELWNWTQKKLLATIRASVLSSMESFTFTKHGDLISASGTGSVKVWDRSTHEPLLEIGDGGHQGRLVGILYLAAQLSLVFGFLGLYLHGASRSCSLVIVSVLSIWSLGLLALALLIRTRLVNRSLLIAWILTVISILSAMTGYLIPLALILIPISLFFGYLNLTSETRDKRMAVPLLLILLLTGFGTCAFLGDAFTG